MYNKKFKSSRYDSIQPFLENIQDLEVWTSLRISVKTSELLQTRWLIYDWLKQMGIKKVFRVSVVDGEICVTKLRKL